MTADETLDAYIALSDDLGRATKAFVEESMATLDSDSMYSAFEIRPFCRSRSRSTAPFVLSSMMRACDASRQFTI